jgi:threonine synthase
VSVRTGRAQALGPAWRGDEDPTGGGPLLVQYPPLEPAGETLSERVGSLSRTLLPIPATEIVELGQGNTPLVKLDALGDGIWAKLEGANPTGSHKDRFHAIVAALARRHGHPGVVAWSTGNHAAAAAAFAAAAGLRCTVLLHPEAPETLRTQILVYGAVIEGDHESRARVAELVDAGWCPATSADPSLAGRANPYGLEGYKAIAHEIVRDLGRVPTAVSLPVASGDTYVGVQRGFRELHERLGLPMPIVAGWQPEDAAPLAATVEQHSAEPVEISEPRSIALSTRDPRSGWHAAMAARRDGLVVRVPDRELGARIIALGRCGVFAEPASALATAGIDHLRRTGAIGPGDSAVAIITSSALNWTRDIVLALSGEAP